MAKAEGEQNETVGLCSQNPYPGDDELERLEIEIMVKWKLDQQPDIAPRPSDPEEAEKNLTSAKNALAEGQSCDALVFIDSALETDTLNAALWLQRATILIAMGDIREAFRSCNALPPPLRTADIWKMGGSVLDKLGLPVTAEAWLRNATKLAEKGDSSAAILFQRIRAKRLYDPLTRDMPVEVIFTNQGRALRTTRAVKKGELIFADTPLLHEQTLPSRKFPCCENCVTSLIRPEDVFDEEELKKPALQKAFNKYWPIRPRVYCTCKRNVYCSEECKQEAWDMHHRFICPEKNPAVLRLYEICDNFDQLTSTDISAYQGWWQASFSPLLLAKLWASIVSGAQKLATENDRSEPSAHDWALARVPYRRFIAYGEGTTAQTIPKMHKLFVDIFKDLGDGLSYTISDKEFSGRYLQLACNVQSFSDADNPMACFCRGIHKDPQLSPLFNYCRSKDHEGDFAGLFPVHACLNHSCFNNAFVSDGKNAAGKPGCHVKAKRDIAAGEEVLNQYIDVSLSRKERQYFLFRSYHFWCNCLRCQFEGDGPEKCTECGKKAGEEKPFPKCSRCKQAWYCSTECQKKAWKRGHKKICGVQG